MPTLAACKYPAALFHRTPATPACFRELPNNPGAEATSREDGQTASDTDEHGSRLVCAACRLMITAPSWRMAVAGSHRHVFANPHGHVFEIGCFAAAPGCAAVGSPTSDFSWFPGTLWQIAVCVACGLHLGWRYIQSDGGRFYGLILDRLLLTPENLA
ncbi:MAG TPA: cereblon family protein [Solidesulfovibrio magneticus]|nr:cereblon family protein [Solidesulfovibrio magneticus]